jgi:hypothetical protein
MLTFLSVKRYWAGGVAQQSKNLMGLPQSIEIEIEQLKEN